MAKEIEIREFKGVFTNADVEDLPVEFLTICKNARPWNGRLLKSFGPGVKIGTAVSPPALSSVYNLCTYIHREFPTENSRYLTVLIRLSDNRAFIYAWNGTAWVAIGDLSEMSAQSMALYQNLGKNPIIQVDSVLRILPGNVGEVSGNEAKGIWIGHIDRKFFDELYEPTVQFYNYETIIEKPDINFTVRQIQGGNFSPTDGDTDRRFYKFSYIYDGDQESLLSDEIEVNYDLAENLYGEFEFTIDKTTHNKRIIALKVYRSDLADGIYKHIHTIDFIRESKDVLSGSSPNGAYEATYIYIPELINFDFRNDLGYTYKIYHRTTSTTFAGQVITTPVRLNNVLFKAPNPWGYQLSCWNVEWYLQEDQGEGYNTVRRGGSGSFGDRNIIILFQTDTGISNAINGLIHVENSICASVSKAETAGGGNQTKFSATNILEIGDVVVLSGFTTDDSYNGTYVVRDCSGTYFTIDTQFISDDHSGKYQVYGEKRFITDNYGWAIRLNREYWGSFTADSSWKLMKLNKGLYYAEMTGNYITYRFYDNNIDEGAEYKLEDEYSIKANGDIAKVIGSRLWQANPVLDPGGKNEEHIGKVCYSELSQYDVNPVSNLISLPDKEGGAVTGIAEILGNPVFTKPHAIHTIDISQVYPPPFPVIKSEHNIGNIAKEGQVQVGEALYICYYDGIYRLMPNNLAESDATPTERLKISDPIGDIYTNLSTQKKEAIVATYDQRKGEIIYTLDNDLWAFNIDTDAWRQIETDVTFSILSQDEDSNVIIYDATDKKVYTLGGDDFVSMQVRLKNFRISDERAEVVRYFYITYKSVTAITLKLYTDYSETEVASYTLEAKGELTTVKLGIRYRAKVFSFELNIASATESSQLWTELGDGVVINPDGLTDTVWELDGDAVILKSNPISNHIWRVDGDAVYLNPLVGTEINRIKIEHS